MQLQKKNKINLQIHGFTLVELLVVISIIALLLSILMPSLQKAREMGKKVVCSSNLKQIGLASELYMNDYNFKYPPAKSYLKETQDWSWSMFLSGYDSGTQYLPVKERKNGKGTSVLVCPAWKKSRGTDTNWSTYGANSNRLNIVWPDGSTTPKIWASTTTLKRLAETVFIYCSANGFTFGSPKNIYGQWDVRHISLHGDRYPILWFDGHTTSEKEDLMKPISATYRVPKGW